MKASPLFLSLIVIFLLVSCSDDSNSFTSPTKLSSHIKKNCEEDDEDCLNTIDECDEDDEDCLNSSYSSSSKSSSSRSSSSSKSSSSTSRSSSSSKSSSSTSIKSNNSTYSSSSSWTIAQPQSISSSKQIIDTTTSSSSSANASSDSGYAKYDEEVLSSACKNSEIALIGTAQKKYICLYNTWTQVLDEMPEKCPKEDESISIVYNSSRYICKSTVWTEISDLEIYMGPCTAKNNLDSAKYNSQIYLCINNAWKITTKEDFLGECKSEEPSEIKSFGDKNYTCKNKNWEETTKAETTLGLCTSELADSIKEINHTKYICYKYDWKIATFENVAGECNTAKAYDTLTYAETQYVCRNSKWVSFSATEKVLGICSPASQGKTGEYNKVIMICDKNSWRNATALEKAGECTNLIQDAVVTESTTKKYVCDQKTWRSFTSTEKTLDKTCTATNLGEKASSSSSYYICEESGWTSISQDIYNLGECTEANEYYVGVAKATGEQYLCKDSKWIIPPVSKDDFSTKPEIFTNATTKTIYVTVWGYTFTYAVDDIEINLGICVKASPERFAYYKDTLMHCVPGNKWKLATLTDYLNYNSCDKISKDIYFEEQAYTCKNGVREPVYGSFQDTRDMKVYKTVKIAKKRWMAENLNYATSNSWCYYDKSEYCEKYGRLYTYDNVTSGKICPSGWHIPSAHELPKSSRIYNSSGDLNGDSWQSGEDDNLTGLSIMGAGFRTENGGYEYEKRLAAFWLSDAPGTSANYGYIYCRAPTNSVNDMCNENDKIYLEFVTANKASKQKGFSIRCVED